MNFSYNWLWSRYSVLLLIITSDSTSGKNFGKSSCGKFCQENPGAYYGILGGSAVAVTILVLVCWYMCYRYKKSRSQSAPLTNGQQPPHIAYPEVVDTSNPHGVPPVPG